VGGAEDAKVHELEDAQAHRGNGSPLRKPERA
jgi:hypothetical protein